MSAYPRADIPVLEPAEAARLLRRVLDRAGELGDRAVVAFDLDSTLLDNRPRQAQILREYGAERGLAALSRHEADHWRGWDARIAMANSGMSVDQIEEHIAPFRAYWKDRFFTSEYCVLDREIPGATAYVREVLARGARVFYVTGRHEEMRRGTVSCFERLGLACPDGAAVELLMKPTLDEHDDAYKLRTYDALRERGVVAAAFDNEPTHINGYREAFPDAIAVHLATDHSMRDIPVAPGIPSIRDFTLG
ncbi:MAG TPA: HAD family hydrolase [Kofleriaceae bacterium]|nr:HAD family hydrolase [Kofleriaceae bacterium]